MAHFDSIKQLQILFHQHYVDDDGKKQERSFLLENNGQLSRIPWKKTSEIKDATHFHTWKLRRGQLYTVYEGLSRFLRNYVPEPERPASEDAYFEVYFFEAGISVYQNPETQEPKPVHRSYAANMFIRGLDVTEMLFNHEKGEKERPFGVEFLEAFFDIAIPFGFEATALSEIHMAVNSQEDPALFEEGEALIKWLIHGEGLPELSDDLREYLQQNADVFREHIEELEIRTSHEVAMIRGSAFLRKIGENDVMYDYLSPLADNEKSGLACYQLALWYTEDEMYASAFKYASIGSSLGDGNASYLASKMCANRGLQDLSRMYVEQGMEAGSGDCFYFMASQIMKFAHDESDHPFKFENPVSAAFYYADEGVQRRSSKAMVFLARLLLDFMTDEGADMALQLLLRAEAAGEKEALYRLAIYYMHDHKGAEGKDLALAESYVKRAIIENAFNAADCQLLYADILLEAGDPKKAIGFVEELARKGNEKAQVFLGRLITGADARYPFVDDPIPVTFLEAIADEKAFFKAVLWRNYPDIISAKKAASSLGKLAKKGEALAFRELAKIHREGPDEIRDEKKAGYFEECFDKYRPK